MPPHCVGVCPRVPGIHAMFSYAAILAQCILATEGARLSHSQILALYPNPVPLPPPRYTSLAPTSSAPPSTLRAAASARGIYIGAAINQACYTNASEPQYQQTYLTEFSLATCENGCKFAALEPSNGVYDFGECSLIANAALNTGKGAFRGHNFIWGESLPPWLTQGNYNGSALKGIMENHISTSLSHFASDPTLPAFECWDVVNEAVCDVGSKDFNCSSPGKPLWKETAWYPSGAGTPGGYVENAFRMARAAADAAAAHATAHAAAAAAGIKLFYNDYGGEGQGEKSDRIYAMLQDFKSRGVPVDGVGLQMHISVRGLAAKHIQTFFPPTPRVCARLFFLMINPPPPCSFPTPPPRLPHPRRWMATRTPGACPATFSGWGAWAWRCT